MKRSFASKIVFVMALVCQSLVGKAYSVLAHEALIDASWDKYFVPLIKEKFPGITDSLLKETHAYAYGGAVAPDMGYYPFGSKLFTNLVHYVRSGDFVTALLNEARNPDEYAFALGALCHYYADVYGHHLGVNASVPIEYPKDKEKFGNLVTYEEDPVSHKRIEFAFDVLETAKGNYATKAYHDFIGFKVADSVLDRAFYKTYKLHLTDIFSNFSRAVGTFRWTVKSFFPVLTKAAWASKHGDIKKHDSTMTAKKFRYRMNRMNYNKEFGRNRDKPRLFSFLFAGLIKILPKIGPLKPLKFKAPSAEVEKLYVGSFDTVEAHYSKTLERLHSQNISLADKDFDTGKDSKPGEYKLTDQTYCDWLIALKKNNFQSVNNSVKQNITDFLNNGVALSEQKEDKKEDAAKALDELKSLKSVGAQ